MCLRGSHQVSGEFSRIQRSSRRSQGAFLEFSEVPRRIQVSGDFKEFPGVFCGSQGVTGDLRGISEGFKGFPSAFSRYSIVYLREFQRVPGGFHRCSREILGGW